MDHLDEIAERIREDFDKRTNQRDGILAQARLLTRHSANAIRAIHRDERLQAVEQLAQASQIAASFRSLLPNFADLYYSGYTQDALKEYAEANIVFALSTHARLPEPGALGIESATYLQGLAEALGELRRRCLDCLISNNSEEANRLLGYMDDVYAVLVTMDYPDAITGGLRRLTDIARSIVERTRGDLTISINQEKLEHSLHRLEKQLQDREYIPGQEDI